MMGGFEGEGGNPFAAPTADGEGITPAGAEEIRREHLAAEDFIQSVGLLAIIAGVVSCAVGVRLCFAGADRFRDPGIPLATKLLPLLPGALGIVGVALGVGLKRYKPVARFAALAFAGLWIVAVLVAIAMGRYPRSAMAIFQIGVAGGTLYTLLGERARRIFSPAYREIVAQTRHVRSYWGA